ncbi:hypothetical protein Vadar_001411 [Vaccinium darrowii]|uniref:Uncharacterized protein n=1 Tax=Vaccinium darrowii TaxID=229202 RepID=A0ACB7YT92_9ERIC|nr:hypothetical protein Vadar_001411 [Vaccinium darrowii]
MAEAVKEGGGEEEGEKLLEGVTVLDFDVLCSTVAMQTQQGKWRKLDEFREDVDNGGGEFGSGVLRMWEGEILDCFDDRRVALQSACAAHSSVIQSCFGRCGWYPFFQFLSGSVSDNEGLMKEKEK